MSHLLSPEEVERFKQMVEDYQLNQSVSRVFEDSNFAVIAGPTGAGKDTLRDDLLAHHSGDYQPILSTTTRPPRPGEQDGVTYHFREVGSVARDIEAQDFFQIELIHSQQLSGLHIDEIRRLHDKQWGVSILVPQAERKLRRRKPDIKTIFLVPPNLKIMRERIAAERLLDRAEVERRLDAACDEIDMALGVDDYYCIVSTNPKRTLKLAHRYLKHNDYDTAIDSQGRSVMNAIVQELTERHM